MVLKAERECEAAGRVEAIFAHTLDCNSSVYILK